MKPNLYLIPGFSDNCIGEGYGIIKNKLKNKYNIIYSNINWKNTSIDDWSTEFSNKYLKTKTTKNIVVGFSYGSMVAIDTAQNLKPDVLILCSLSPFFSEYLDRLPKTWIKSESKKRLDGFKKTSITKLSKNIKNNNININLLVGEKELRLWPNMKSAFDEYKKLLNPKSVTVVPKARHRLESNYQNELINLLKTL